MPVTAPNAVADVPLTDAPKVTATLAQAKAKDAGAACDSKECWKGLITQYARRYGVDPKLAVAVAQCESELRTDVYGDHGLAYGIYQFHENTFNLFAREFKLSGMRYSDPEDSIQLAMISLANGKGDHWSCYRKLTREQ